MSSPAEVVSEQFSEARAYADSALASVASFTAALSTDIYPAPTIEVTFAPVEAPAALTIPDRPAGFDELEDEFVWDGTGDIAGSKPGDLSVVAPDITIDDFTDVAPVLDFGDKPVLDFGTAPEVVIGDAPVVPEIAEITVPDAPTIDAVATPTYLTLTTPTFAGLDLHEDLLEQLETIPTLDLVAPTPYSYSPGPNYESDLLDGLKALLLTRSQGGTGLPPAVEQAIWDRARDRETSIALGALGDISRNNEALAFQLPTGILTEQLRLGQKDYYDKLSGLSRDVAIKQADLEQENMKDTIAQGMTLEGKLIDYSYNLERLAYETAKTVAENAVSRYNAQVDKFKAVLETYRLYAQAYETIINAEKLKVEVYRAELAGEQAKADANRTLVEQYKAQIEAGLSLVRIFEAQVGGARARMELEQAKIGAVKTQIEAYVAGINGQTAKVEAYKVGVQAQATIMEAYRTGVQAEGTRVEVYKAQAQAFSAKAGAQGEKARVQLGYYAAQVQAYAAQWEGWRARVGGESARFQALAAKSGGILDAYKASVQATIAEAEQNASRWRTQISEYEAVQNYTFQAAKINNDNLQATRQSILDASKVGAQVYAQLAASAISAVHVSAGVSASASNSVSYSYSNETDSAPTSVTAV